MECWRPYSGIDKIYEKTIEGIKHIIFPSQKSNLFFPEIEVCKEMKALLKDRIQNSSNLLLHCHGLHSNFFSLNFSTELLSKIPVFFRKQEVDLILKFMRKSFGNYTKSCFIRTDVNLKEKFLSQLILQQYCTLTSRD